MPPKKTTQSDKKQKASESGDNLPAYLRIEKHLLSLINKGEGRSSPLPPEKELSTKFDVSRMTVRQAYQRLVNSGIIVRYSGIGSFATGHAFEDMPIQGIPDFSAWSRSGSQTTRHVLKYEIISAPTSVTKALGLRNGGKITHLERLRINNGVPTIDTRYMPKAVFSKISKEEIEKSSLAKLLSDAGFHIASGQIEMDAHIATAREAATLGVKPGHPIIERRITLGDKNGKCFFIGKSRHPSGKSYTYRLQFHAAGDETVNQFE